MDFTFFDTSGLMLFVRSDAEDAHWVQQEMSLTCVFPFDAEKTITRGMRIGFNDPATGTFETFEVRVVQNIEPDHYQQITAEHIAVAELSDEHIDTTEITDKTPQQALTTALAGVNYWNVGTVGATNISSCDIGRGSVWQAIKTIEQNWNVYCIPRVTVTSAGISGRYIDIVPTGGTFRGVRLSIRKNIADASVTYDDTEVLTALYGYGGNVDVPQSSGDDKTEELTFEDVTWSATSAHPAKPAGQKYLEWPEKTALYGRNGRPRFGYYQNADIESASVLLQKTWEALQETCEPKISITGTVADLHRLGYADQPLRLHDKAIVEIEETGELFNREIIALDVNLLDPTATTPEIGDYISNIIYINRDTDEIAATGRSGGGGGGGGRGSKNSTYDEAKTFTAWTKDSEKIGMVVGMKNGDPYILAGEITLAINKSDGTSIATIDADHIMIGNEDAETVINGKATITQLNAVTAEIDNLKTGITKASILSAGHLKGDQATIGSLAVTNTPITMGGVAGCGMFTISVNGEAKARFLGTANVNFDRAAAYNEGWNDCIDACVSHTYLRSYSSYNNKNAVSLWTAPNSYGTQVGPYVWWHGGNETTAYTIPQKK